MSTNPFLNNPITGQPYNTTFTTPQTQSFQFSTGSPIVMNPLNTNTMTSTPKTTNNSILNTNKTASTTVTSNPFLLNPMTGQPWSNTTTPSTPSLPASLTNVPKSNVSGNGPTQNLTEEQLIQNTIKNNAADALMYQNAAMNAMKAGTDTSVKSTSDYLTKYQKMQEQVANQPGGSNELGAGTSELTKTLKDLYLKSEGKGAMTKELYNTTNIAGNVKTLQDLNTRMANLSNQFGAAYESLSAGTGLSTTIQGKQGQLARQKAVELGGLSATAQAMQGNIDSARQLINDTVNMEFADTDQKIADTKSLLELNMAQYDDKQKEEANQMLYALDQQEKQQATDKENKKAIYDLAISAAKNGADATTISKINSSTDINTAMQNAGSYLSDAKKQEITILSDWVTKYSDAGLTMSDTLASAQAKIKNSKIYQKEIKSGSTSTTSKEEKATALFQKTAADYITQIDQGKLNAPAAVQALKAQFPDAADETINGILGIDTSKPESKGNYWTNLWSAITGKK